MARPATSHDHPRPPPNSSHTHSHRGRQCRSKKSATESCYRQTLLAGYTGLDSCLATMEQSSPLAAMHPPSVHFGHCFGAEPASSFTQFPAAVPPFGPDSFNFRDLSMKRARADYFTAVKPAARPSPTVSLAADLSQNFHIDQRCVFDALSQTSLSLSLSFSPASLVCLSLYRF